MNVRLAGPVAVARENECEMEICESSSLTAIANRSLDMSRSLTDKIAADADDSDDDDENDDHIASSVSNGKQVVQLSYGSL